MPDTSDVTNGMYLKGTADFFMLMMERGEDDAARKIWSDNIDSTIDHGTSTAEEQAAYDYAKGIYEAARAFFERRRM